MTNWRPIEKRRELATSLVDQHRTVFDQRTHGAHDDGMTRWCCSDDTVITTVRYILKQVHLSYVLPPGCCNADVACLIDKRLTCSWVLSPPTRTTASGIGVARTGSRAAGHTPARGVPVPPRSPSVSTPSQDVVNAHRHRCDAAGLD